MGHLNGTASKSLQIEMEVVRGCKTRNGRKSKLAREGAESQAYRAMVGRSNLANLRL